MSVTIQFHGAARTVTGSCYRVQWPGGAVLVDCGMFQGSKSLKELNYGGFAFDVAGIDAVLLTHAHIDHAGLVPKLWRAGYRGPIIATEGTADLLTYMLPDSGYIQEMEVEQLNRRNVQRGRPPVAPIYTRADAERCLELLRPVERDEWTPLPGGARARFWNAGHILGACSVELEVPTGEAGAAPLRLLFSGDVGPSRGVFHAPPEGPQGCDLVMMEGTYGDRERTDLTPDQRRAVLADEVLTAIRARGNVIVPVFAVERTQELLHDLAVLFDSGALPPTQVFLDSPLAIKATEVFRDHRQDFANGHEATDPFRRPYLHFVEDVEDSKRLAKVSGAVILSASGMCDAGRIRFHLRNNLWRPDSTVLLVGYQAPGTLGSLLENGARWVRIMGEEVTVKARIRRLEAYSGHADRSELLDWMAARMPVGRAMVLTHGEETALSSLRQALIERGMDEHQVLVPGLGEALEIPAKGRLRLLPAAAPPPTPAADWHNRYAALLLEMQERMRTLPEPRREKLLAKLERELRAS